MYSSSSDRKKQDFKYNIIGNSNPLIIRFPLEQTGLITNSRKRKKLEITDFTWMGTYPRVHQSISVEGVDPNIPPNYFYFKIDNISSEGSYNEKGGESQIVDFAYPAREFGYFSTLQGTTAAEGAAGAYNNADRPGGNIITDWFVETQTTTVTSYSFAKILYEISENNEENIDLGNLAGTTLVISIQANVPRMLARAGAPDPDPEKGGAILLQDKFGSVDIVYPFKNRNVSRLGNLTEDYILRFTIYEDDF